MSIKREQMNGKNGIKHRWMQNTIGIFDNVHCCRASQKCTTEVRQTECAHTWNVFQCNRMKCATVGRVHIVENFKCISSECQRKSFFTIWKSLIIWLWLIFEGGKRLLLSLIERAYFNEWNQNQAVWIAQSQSEFTSYDILTFWWYWYTLYR